MCTPLKSSFLLSGFVLCSTLLGQDPSPIADYNSSRTYSTGELVLVDPDSYIATQAVPINTPPPNTTYWTNLSVAASTLNIPSETVPTLSTETILGSLPGSAPDTNSSGLPAAGDSNSYLLDISTAGYVSPSAKMSGGFIITGGQMKVLITAKGSNENGVDPLNNPRLEIVPLSRDSVLASNTDWTSSADVTAITATGFMANYKSTDAAAILTLGAGAYLADVFSQDSDSGGALVEVFDLDAVENTSTPAKLLDISTNGTVLPGSSPGQKMTAGFIISGGTDKRVLITAKGSLEGGVDTLNNPRLQVLPVSRASVAGSNTDWTSGEQAQVNAITNTGFMSGYDAADAAVILTLTQGAYLVDVFSEDTDSGKALVEVFDLDILVNDLNMVLE